MFGLVNFSNKLHMHVEFVCVCVSSVSVVSSNIASRHLVDSAGHLNILPLKTRWHLPTRPTSMLKDTSQSLYKDRTSLRVWRL